MGFGQEGVGFVHVRTLAIRHQTLSIGTQETRGTDGIDLERVPETCTEGRTSGAAQELEFKFQDQGWRDEGLAAVATSGANPSDLELPRCARPCC